MTKVPDQKKLRWEYLRKKGVLAVRITLVKMSLSLFVMALWVAFVLAWKGLFLGAVAVVALMALSMLAIPYYVLKYGFLPSRKRVLRDLQRQAHSLSSIPPVTPSTRLAEEVLVRGATGTGVRE